MDGLDLSAIDKFYSQVFNSSPIHSDDEELDQNPCSSTGTNHKLSDSHDENGKCISDKTRSEMEFELELSMLKPNSIRREIFEQSLRDAKNGAEMSEESSDEEEADDDRQQGDSDHNPVQDTNVLPDADQVPNEATNDDFQCPYCFRPFPEFNNLEAHVDNCKHRTSIDVYRSYFRPRNLNSQTFNSQNSTSTTPVSQTAKKPKIIHSQTTSGKKGKGTRRKKNTITAFLTPCSSISTRSQTAAETDENRPKLSYYQRFLELNSPSLSQTPKVDPFQCPHCMHGFLAFETLQTHVIMCTKKKN